MDEKDFCACDTCARKGTCPTTQDLSECMKKDCKLCRKWNNYPLCYRPTDKEVA